MRFLRIAAIVAAVILAVGLALTRVPAVEDALFERMLNQRFSGSAARLFDGDGLKVAFCGTGSPLPSPRAQTCTAVFAGERFFLVDSGTGSWETLAVGGMPGERLAGIFLTHFHSDHIGDLGEANLGSWIAGRSAPLPVYGPAGVARVVEGENEAFALDSLYRTAHHGEAVASSASAGLEARAFNSDEPRVVFDEGGLKVTAFPVKHDPVVPAVGYRFDYQGRSVVISGDTAYSESLVANANGVDVLISEAQANHMVAKMQEAAERAGNQRLAKILSDIPDYHTSPEEAARAANEAGAGLLVLTHLTPAPDNAVARRIFMRGVAKARKDVRVAEDGLVILLPADGGVRYARL
jgi:ribonuclease Z